MTETRAAYDIGQRPEPVKLGLDLRVVRNGMVGHGALIPLSRF